MKTRIEIDIDSSVRNIKFILWKRTQAFIDKSSAEHLMSVMEENLHKLTITVFIPKDNVEDPINLDMEDCEVRTVAFELYDNYYFDITNGNIIYVSELFPCSQPEITTEILSKLARAASEIIEGLEKYA